MPFYCDENEDEICLQHRLKKDIATLILICIAIFLTYRFVKKMLRMVAVNRKPIGFITAGMVMLYTIKFSKCNSFEDFVADTISNGLILIINVVGLAWETFNSVLENYLPELKSEQV